MGFGYYGVVFPEWFGDLEGLGFRVQGSGFRVQGLGFRDPTGFRATMNPQLRESESQVYCLKDSYLSGIMGNQRLTFFIIRGLYRDYTTPKG